MRNRPLKSLFVRGIVQFLRLYSKQEIELRPTLFAKFAHSSISKSYDQNKFSCFPLMKTARINEKGGLYKGENLACSHVQIQDPKKKAAHSKNAF